MGGWIKLHSQIRNWQHYQEPSVLLVFIDLLLTANFENSEFNGVEIHRGQNIRSLSTICKSTGLSINTVRTALSKLVKSGEIKYDYNKQCRVTTIVNYEQYQTISKNDSVSKNDIASGVSKNDTITDYTEEYININNAHVRKGKHKVWEYLQELLNSSFNVESWCMLNRSNKEEFFNIAVKIATEWELVNPKYPNDSFMRKNFINSVTLELEKKRRNATIRSTYEEQRDKLYADSAALVARLAAEDDARAAKVRNT